MKFLEKDLEVIIWESDNEKLRQRNLPIEGKKFRQLKIGNYGVADLVTFTKRYAVSNSTMPYLEITVYELKKEKIGISAFLQSLKYCKGITAYLEKNKPEMLFTINIVLCAKEIDLSGDFIYITDLFKCMESFNTVNEVLFYTFNYDFDGINFQNHQGYDLIHKGF